MSDDQKKQLEQQLWNITNTLRGKMDADELKIPTPYQTNSKSIGTKNNWQHSRNFVPKKTYQMIRLKK